jgi:hypothetical protein
MQKSALYRLAILLMSPATSLRPRWEETKPPSHKIVAALRHKTLVLSGFKSDLAGVPAGASYLRGIKDRYAMAKP